jgi:short-chain fatty acids transporter
MIQAIGRTAYRLAKNWIPDPLVFALLLTGIAFLMGMVLSPLNDYSNNGIGEVVNAAGRMIGFWQDGFWNLLAFAMQMSLILVLGGAVARSQPVEMLITNLARRPKSGSQAAALVAFVSCVAGLLNWGLGLVVGAMMARKVATLAIRRRIVVHYPLLGAAGYTCMLVWHGGLSGSGPLAMNTSGSQLVASMGGVTLALEQTIFSPLNLVMTTALLIAVPLICYYMAPKYRGGEEQELDLLPADVMAGLDDRIPESFDVRTPADKIEDNGIFLRFFGIVGLAVILWQFISSQFTLSFLNLNSVNWILFFLAMTLHGSVKQFLAAVSSVAGASVGIIVQFPFYAGIMGMMISSQTINVLAEGIASITIPVLYPIVVFFTSGLVNVFVPSGGGQVAVQGPFTYEVCKILNVPFDLGFMALCYGDQITNMLQPFWALPLLGLTGLKARDLLGYTITIMLICGLLMIGILFIFSLLMV